MTDETSLQSAIDERVGPMTRPATREAVAAMVADLERRGAVPGLDVGDPAPDFVLPDAHGRPVGLADRLSEGPVVLSFYRGAWCPICDLELRALQANLGAVQARGASLVAVSPQAPDTSLSFAEKLELGFDVLSDLDQSVAAAYRLRFRLSDELARLYEQVGLALPEQNADGSWDLPVPATFVLDAAGIVRARHVDPNYRQRMEPAVILAALDDLAR